MAAYKQLRKILIATSVIRLYSGAMTEMNFMWHTSGTWYFFLDTCFLRNRLLHISSQGFDLLTNNFWFVLFFPTNALDCYCEGTSVQCNSSSISYGNHSDPHLHVHNQLSLQAEDNYIFQFMQKSLK